MNDINLLVEDLRRLIATSEHSAAERFQVGMNRMAGFLAEAFGGDKDDAAIVLNNERLGVVQISRKRSAYNEPGPDFRRPASSCWRS